MVAGRRAGSLLDAPRGRHFCLAIAEWLMPEVRGALPAFAKGRWSARSRDALIAELSKATAYLPESVNTGSVFTDPFLTDLLFIELLGQTVDAAMYWQEPYDDDRILEHSDVRSALEPIAEMVAHSPLTGWWSDPMPSDLQKAVRWLDDTPNEIRSSADASVKLAKWKAAAVADEVSARSRPEDPAAPFSGEWWSTPERAGLPYTTRSTADLGAIGLALVEDGFGWSQAEVSSVAVTRGSRVFEIDGPEGWIDLVGRYPMDVTLTRRHDWWRATGTTGVWQIPDWQKIADEYDGVHLTIWGYLTTAGKALPVSGANTVLAGWSPDVTYWLTQLVSLDEDAVEWTADVTGQHSWSPTTIDKPRM